jgi:hypothetical protein
VQRAVGLAAAARGADVIVDECLRHDALLGMMIVIYKRLWRGSEGF